MTIYKTSQREGVFADNRQLPIHRWYPFIEGYSSLLVKRALDEHPSANSIFDPFSGSGTTALTAAMNGRPSTYTEVNPYLRWVAQVKTEASQLLTEQEIEKVLEVIIRATTTHATRQHEETPIERINKKRHYFNDETMSSISWTLQLIENELKGAARDIARLAVASALVPSSNMMRRTDLRRRTSKDPQPLDFRAEVLRYATNITHDVRAVGSQITAQPRCIGSNALGPFEHHAPFDLIITSPPYLNGTNYCRNTKLELFTLGFIQKESDLELLRPEMVTSGINNVSAANRSPIPIFAIAETVGALEKVTYDQRVPKMVTRYFSDMHAVLKQLNASSSPGASLWLDIGDSKYSGVHVKTDELLKVVAHAAGWAHIETETLRQRRSYDGTKLSQVLIKFKKVGDLE